jgi:hypothetical protein
VLTNPLIVELPVVEPEPYTWAAQERAKGLLHETPALRVRPRVIVVVVGDGIAGLEARRQRNDTDAATILVRI